MISLHLSPPRPPHSPGVSQTEGTLPACRAAAARGTARRGRGVLPAGPLGRARRGPARRSVVSDRRGAQPARRPAGGPMSGGGGAAGPRLYGYGSALPPAALLRRGLAAAASEVGSAALGTTVAGAASLPSLHSFSSAVGCVSAQVPRPSFLLLSQPPRRTLQVAQRERDDLTLRPPRPPVLVNFIFYFCNHYCPSLFLSLLRSGVFAGDKDGSAPRGSRSPADAPPRDWGS